MRLPEPSPVRPGRARPPHPCALVLRDLVLRDPALLAPALFAPAPRALTSGGAA